MGLLIKPYEISLWRDEWDATKKVFLEKRMMTIGSDKMETQSRALEPKLIRKTNGEVTFSFKMYYLYIDNITGEKVENFFTNYLTNETKIKLEYDNRLFHFFIKNIDKDSAAKTYTYSLVDQYVTELSKNGFDLVLDSTQMNNIGTSEELGCRILEGTGWTLESEKIVQTQEESLVTLKLPTNLTGYRIFRVNDSKTNLISQGATATELSLNDKKAMQGKLIYAFYSSCSGEKPFRFQFLYSSADFSTKKQNSDGLITEEGCQYYIDGLTYTIGVKEENSKGEEAWIVIPTNFVYTFPELALGNNSPISMLYRGKRYAYNHESDFHVGLNQYVKKYQGSDGNRYYGYTKTHYVTPNCLQNLVTNSDFSGTSGWRGAKFIDIERTEAGAYDYSSAIPLTVFNNSEAWMIWKNVILSTDVYTWRLPYTFNATNIDDYPVGQNVYIDGTIYNQNDANIRIYGTVVSQASVGTYGDYEIAVAYHDVSIGYGLLNASINSIAVREEGTYEGKLRLRTSLRDQLLGNFNETNEYFSMLECGALAGGKGLKKVITNSGPYDIKNRLEGFTSGEKYIVEVEFYHAELNDDGDYVISSEPGIKGDPNFRLRMSNFELKTEQDGYGFECWEDFGYDSNVNGQRTLFSIQANAREEDDGFIKLVESEKGHYTLTQEVEMAATLSKTGFLEDNYTLFIEFPNTSSNDYWLIKKLRIYKKFLKADGSFYTPDDAIDIDNSTYQEEQKYFLIQEGVDNRSEEEIKFLGKNSGVIMTPLLTSDAERKSSISIKESNYFNAIQTLAETFECWPSIEVNYSSDGEITKKIKLQNYVGQSSPIGFKYGLNSKDIKRTLDSKEIVSKLIVKANSNEYADHGFCTVAKAAANATGDNVLYDFSHYIRQGLIDAQQLQTNLYVATAQELASLETKLSANTKLSTTDIASTITSALGYYPKLRKINIALTELGQQMADKSIPLSKAQSDYNTSKIGYDSAVADITKVKDNFVKTAGFSIDSAFTDVQQQQIQSSSTLGGYLAQWTELVKQKQDFQAKYLKAENDLNNLENAYSLLTIKNNNAIALKKRLNQLFYLLYSSYIQEGTWIDESYTDENLYYNDALSVSANSAKPQVSYSINVISLAGIPEYNDIDFRVGDQTFIEDIEFFGLDPDGNPYQEQITITETQENLDDPSKNSIKVQNYENQFQDLFQRITATVQSVQYSEGDTNKARELANANTAFKISYLNDALTDASTVLSNAGNQTWRLDAEGLTLESESTRNKLRAVGGAILLGQKDEATGHDKWVTGITSEGVSANLITTGQLDTGLIQIMNGNQPTFRWDTHGITAYGFDNSSNDVILSGLDTQKGVRFDRFGIYGYTGIDGEKWHPTTISGASPVPTIDEKSTFYLTWEGLKVVSQKEGKPRATLRIGDNAKVNKDDPAIFKVTKRVHDSTTNQDIEEMQLEITDSGAMRWGKGVGATQVVYSELVNGKPPMKPQKAEDGEELFYDTFEDEATETQNWHKVKTANDKYSSITYDGGYTWEDPVQIKDTVPYSLSLSSSFDTMVITTDGQVISTPPTIAATAYLGANIATDIDINCYPQNEAYTGDYYTFDTEAHTLTILEKDRYPGDCIFTFELRRASEEEGGALITKDFSLKIITSDVDYDLVVNPTIVNTSESDSEISWFVQKKGLAGVEELTTIEQMQAANLQVLKDGAEWDDFTFTIAKDTKSNVQLELKQNDITWDLITIETVHNGDDANVTYLNMWQAFYDAADEDGDGNYAKGIIAFTDKTSGKKYIGINADLIQTGAINVGGTIDNEFEDAIFFADIDKSTVHIAGFNVDQTTIFSDPYNFGGESLRTAWRTPSENHTSSDAAFAIGYKNGYALTTAPCYVTFDGYLHATGGDFSNGTISGGTINIGDGKFQVALNGDVTLAGSITWGADASPVQAVYARTAIEKPANNTKYPDGFDLTSDSTWHTQLDSVNDKYTSYTYDGGITWTSTIQFAGEPGEPGTPGAPGKGIQETTIGYQKHTNGTTAPSGTWSKNIPTIGDGEFLWTRTQITYTDGTVSTSYAVSSKGGKGDPGDPGTPVTISSIQYAKHSSATSPPSSGWGLKVPAVSGTQPYLWTKVTYSDGSVAYTCAKNTITRDELWSFLGSNDGIYEDDNGNIAIRATAIISGALQVGGETGQPDSDGVRFYADMAGDTVKIGGWTIDENGALLGQYNTGSRPVKVVLSPNEKFLPDENNSVPVAIGVTYNNNLSFGVRANGTVFGDNIQFDEAVIETKATIGTVSADSVCASDFLIVGPSATNKDNCGYMYSAQGHVYDWGTTKYGIMFNKPPRIALTKRLLKNSDTEIRVILYTAYGALAYQGSSLYHYAWSDMEDINI